MALSPREGNRRLRRSARLAGHASSRTTEVVYRRELRPVITTGAEIMDQIFQPKHRREASAEAAG